MTEIAKVYVGVVPSFQGITGNIRKGLNGPLEAEAASAGAAAGTAASESFGESFDSTKALIGAAAIGTGLFGLATAAGDLEAALAANVQVLGEASGAVQEFAANGEDAVFLTETAVLDATTAFGQLGKIMGLSGEDLSGFAIDFATLSADMAAFKNNTPAEAIRDLQAGFAGSTEVLRKYGIFLDDVGLKQAYYNETGIKVTGTLTAQQRILATASEIWRQTGDIQGQAAREADSFESSIAALKETVGNIAADFGKPVVGFAADLLGGVEGAAGKLGEFNEATGGMFATGVTAALGVTALAGAFVGIRGKVKQGVDWFGRASTATRRLSLATAGLGIALVAGLSIYGAMTAHSKRLAAEQKVMVGAMDEATAATYRQAQANAELTGTFDAGATAAEAIGVAMLEGLSEIDDETLSSLNITADEFGETLVALREDPLTALTDIGKAAGLSAEEAGVLAAVIGEFGSASNDYATDDLVVSIMSLGDGFDFTREEAEALAEAIGPLGGQIEDVWDSAQGSRIHDVAQGWLQAAAASDDLARSLIEQAEANSGLSLEGDYGFNLYTELLAIIDKLPPAQKAAAEEALNLAGAEDALAEAAKDVQPEMVGVVDATTDATDAFNEAEAAADSFSNAFDRLIGVNTDASDALIDYEEGLDDLNELVDEAVKKHGANADQIDIETAAGRENAKALNDQADSIGEVITNMLRQGATMPNVRAEYNRMYRQLHAVTTELLGSEEAATEYLATLGLTPDTVRTAVNLVGEERATAAVEAYMDEVDEIPASIATIIKARMDQGDFQYVESLIRRLSAPRSVYFQPRMTTGGGVDFMAASGALLTGPAIGLAGEDGAEWIAPLTKPAEMAEWLKRDEIRGPVLQGLALEPFSPHGGTDIGQLGPLVGELHIGDRDDLPEAMEQLDRLRWLVSKGGAR